MRETAVKGVGNACKRFPALALPSLAPLLAALARLPLPDQARLAAAFDASSAAEGAPYTWLCRKFQHCVPPVAGYVEVPA